MATQGWNSPTSASLVTQSPSGTNSWTNPTYVYSDDDSPCTYSPSLPRSTRFNKTTGYGFSIPADATIDGVIVEIKKKCKENVPGTVYALDLGVQLVTSGSINGNNNGKLSTEWSTSYSYVSYGSNVDKWGLSLTPAIINSTDFGAAFCARVAGTPDTSQIAYVDHIRITVYYTEGAGAEPKKILLVSNDDKSNGKKALLRA